MRKRRWKGRLKEDEIKGIENEGEAKGRKGKQSRVEERKVKDWKKKDNYEKIRTQGMGE